MTRRKVKRRDRNKDKDKDKDKALGHKISILQKSMSLARAVNKVIQN